MRINNWKQHEQQRVAVGPGNAQCMSIRQVSLRRGQCGHSNVVRRRRSSVNFRGAQNFCQKICKNQQNARILHDSRPKNYQNTRIFKMILARKILQNSRILHDFCPKNARIVHNNCPKIPPPPNFRGARAPLLSPRLLRLWWPAAAAMRQFSD